jgi:hypothetical protein
MIRTMSVVIAVCVLLLTFWTFAPQASPPFEIERRLQSVIFLNQKREVIVDFLNANNIRYGAISEENCIGFNIRDIRLSGWVSQGMGVRVCFDRAGKAGKVNRYEFERHLTGP